MFYEYQVATIIDSNCIVTGFNQRLKWLNERGLALNIDEYNINQLCRTYNLILHGDNIDNIFQDDDIIFIFKHQIAEVLAEHIINDWEDSLLWKEVNRSCKSNSTEEKKIIFYKAYEFLKKYNENESLNMLVKYNRKNKMAHRLLEYINESKMIVIEGFINFYVPDYLDEIRMAVDLAFEELKNEKEYNEFVKLLRYFVDTQPPKSYEVNLLIGSKGVFYLWDEKGSTIEEKYMNYYLDDMLLDEINLDDILISILITIAPRRIILHNISAFNQNEAVDVIQKVFKDKISFCNSCEKCCQYLRESERT